MAKRKKEGDVPAFPDMQNLNAQTADAEEQPAMTDAPGMKKCVCVTKHIRKGALVPVGKIGYFDTVPEHYEEID